MALQFWNKKPAATQVAKPVAKKKTIEEKLAVIQKVRELLFRDEPGDSLATMQFNAQQRSEPLDKDQIDAYWEALGMLKRHIDKS